MKPVCHSNEMCPLMRKRRNRVCHDCAWFKHVVGRHPQTGEQFDKWDCSIALLPMLLIENARETSRTTDALLDLRNEVNENAQRNARIQLARLSTAMQQAQPQQAPPLQPNGQHK